MVSFQKKRPSLTLIFLGVWKKVREKVCESSSAFSSRPTLVTKRTLKWEQTPIFLKPRSHAELTQRKNLIAGGFRGGKFVRSGYILDSSLFEYKNCIKDRTIYLGRNKYFWVKYQTSFYEIYIINGSDNKHIG